MTSGEMLAGRFVSPGTVALAIITAGAPAAMAPSKGSSPACWRLLHGWVVAGATSVFPDASPSPGKCFTTGTIPPASSPCRNAMPSALATLGLRLKDLVPSGSRLLGPTPSSRSRTGARSMVTPAVRMRDATAVTRLWICAGDIVSPIVRADGREPTRLAMRWTAPPSSSVITSGAMPLGAAASSACRARCEIRRCG